jgi:hypothetical protein
MTREEAEKLHASIARARSLLEAGLQRGGRRSDLWAAVSELGEALGTLADAQPPCAACGAPMRASTGFRTCGNDHPIAPVDSRIKLVDTAPGVMR